MLFKADILNINLASKPYLHGIMYKILFKAS